MIDGVNPECAREHVDFRLPGASGVTDSPEIRRERLQGWARGLNHGDLLHQYLDIAKQVQQFDLIGVNLSTPGSALISALLLTASIPGNKLSEFNDLAEKGHAVQTELSLRLNGVIEELFAKDPQRFAQAYREYLKTIADNQRSLVKGVLARGQSVVSNILGPERLKRHLQSMIETIPQHLELPFRAQTSAFFVAHL